MVAMSWWMARVVSKSTTALVGEYMDAWRWASSNHALVQTVGQSEKVANEIQEDPRLQVGETLLLLALLPEAFQPMRDVGVEADQDDNGDSFAAHCRAGHVGAVEGLADG